MSPLKHASYEYERIFVGTNDDKSSEPKPSFELSQRQAVEEKVDLEAATPPQSAQVLIVDDDPMNVEVLKAMLYEKNIPSDTVLNGKDAIMLVRERLKLV